jgi:large subunit ribosomal protein L22
MQVTAKLNNLRIAPRKSKIVADLIKGLDVKDAFDQLDVHVKRTSPHLKKLLASAIANGENNFGIDRNNMYVLDVRVGEGVTLKRWRARAFGRAGKIMKRTSKIEIILEERVEGKGRKTKEEIEKKKKERLQIKKKLEKEKEKREKEETKKKKAISKKAKIKKKEELKKEEKTGSEKKGEKGWVKKVFRRKSM